MQKILAALRSGQRPVIFFAPFVSAHHEYFDRLLFRESILRSFQQGLVPSQGHFVRVEVRRGRTETDMAILSAAAGRPADRHEQPLSRARSISSVHSNPRIVPERAALKNVVPGSDGERWNIDVAV